MAEKSLPNTSWFMLIVFSPASNEKDMLDFGPVFGSLIVAEFEVVKRLDDFPLFKSILRLSMRSSTTSKTEKSLSDPLIF